MQLSGTRSWPGPAAPQSEIHGIGAGHRTEFADAGARQHGVCGLAWVSRPPGASSRQDQPSLRNAGSALAVTASDGGSGAAATRQGTAPLAAWPGRGRRGCRASSASLRYLCWRWPGTRHSRPPRTAPCPGSVPVETTLRRPIASRSGPNQAAGCRSTARRAAGDIVAEPGECSNTSVNDSR